MDIRCCFLIDATGSMGPYIESAKRQARNIMTALVQEHPNSRFLFGAVFYRDFEDTRPFEIIPFMDDISLQIQSIDAYGGYDIPEDVAGGYEKVLDMNWDLADLKFCFHIADAPAHGNEWHDPDIFDDDTHAIRRDLHEIITDMHMQNIRLTFVRINSTTDRMIEIFQTIYRNEINIIDLMDAEENATIDRELSSGVTRYISCTLSMFE